MKTIRLYEEDVRLGHFTARVQQCAEADGGWEIVLDRTAFYPGGGGQPCDRGTLERRDVLSVREEDGVIFHKVEMPLLPGEEIRGQVDMAHRIDYAQQHTADHILTGVIHRRYGYDNVGFHMGRESTFIDLDGVLDEGELEEMERVANEVLWMDLPVQVSWPDSAALARLDYRSKKELHGAVRIVTIPGVDVCACCGVHMRSTGEVGCIKILSCTRLRGGVRIEYVAGRRAYACFAALQDQNRLISVALSAKPLRTAEAVRRLRDERDALQMRCARLEEARCTAVAQQLRGRGDVLWFEEGLESDGVRRLADAIARQCGGMALVCSGEDGAGYRYALAQKDGDVRVWGAAMNRALQGRGGGRDGCMMQGSLAAGRGQIEDYFHQTEK